MTAGCTEVRACQLALLITVNFEGATILARTFHSWEPFERVADELGGVLSQALAE
jgi:hypothetical protein